LNEGLIAFEDLICRSGLPYVRSITGGEELAEEDAVADDASRRELINSIVGEAGFACCFEEQVIEI
jgi:hypothetical protein